jgi:hypothetical protein
LESRTRRTSVRIGGFDALMPWTQRRLRAFLEPRPPPLNDLVPLQSSSTPRRRASARRARRKRLEDDRLLAGKGLFSDDREFPDQAWLVSCARRTRTRRSPRSTCRRSGGKGVFAAWSMADLRATA